MMLTILLMSLGTLVLALTPGYASIGLTAPVIVVLARLIQGFALGGDVGPASAILIVGMVGCVATLLMPDPKLPTCSSGRSDMSP